MGMTEGIACSFRTYMWACAMQQSAAQTFVMLGFFFMGCVFMAWVASNITRR